MRKRSDQDQKDKVATERAMTNIEAAAQRQYEADKAAEEAHKQAQKGKWVRRATQNKPSLQFN